MMHLCMFLTLFAGNFIEKIINFQNYLLSYYFIVNLALKVQFSKDHQIFVNPSEILK